MGERITEFDAWENFLWEDEKKEIFILQEKNKDLLKQLSLLYEGGKMNEERYEDISEKARGQVIGKLRERKKDVDKMIVMVPVYEPECWEEGTEARKLAEEYIENLQKIKNIKQKVIMRMTPGDIGEEIEK